LLIDAGAVGTAAFGGGIRRLGARTDVPGRQRRDRGNGHGKEVERHPSEESERNVHQLLTSVDFGAALAGCDSW
jgi:hypothetical protein